MLNAVIETITTSETTVKTLIIMPRQRKEVKIFLSRKFNSTILQFTFLGHKILTSSLHAAIATKV